jgi:hypothetical protein
MLAAFSRACAQRGWVILELAPRRTSLEDIFMATAYSDRDSSGQDLNESPGDDRRSSRTI